MTIEQQALDLVEENEALKAQVNMTREQLKNALDYIGVFEGKFCGFGEHLWEEMPPTKLNYSNAKSIINKTPEQCLNSVKIKAVEEFFNDYGGE